jgi:hypothetical protein
LTCSRGVEAADVRGDADADDSAGGTGTGRRGDRETDADALSSGEAVRRTGGTTVVDAFSIFFTGDAAAGA